MQMSRIQFRFKNSQKQSNVIEGFRTGGTDRASLNRRYLDIANQQNKALRSYRSMDNKITGQINDPNRRSLGSFDMDKAKQKQEQYRSQQRLLGQEIKKNLEFHKRYNPDFEIRNHTTKQ